MHRGEISQVAQHDLGAKSTQLFCAFILTANQSAHFMPLGEEHFGDIAADATNRAGRSCHQNWPIMCSLNFHIFNLLDKYKCTYAYAHLRTK